MRKPILLLFWALFVLSEAHSQGLSLFLDNPTKWVNAGNINVTGSNLTLEAMVRITAPNSGNIISKHSNNTNINYLLRAQSFEITTTNGYVVLNNPFVLQPNVTYHLAATYNGSMMRFYVNGCLTAEQAWTGSLVTNTVAMAVGQQSTCQCEQFLGFLDEVRVWNVARTEAQIRGNMYNIANPNFQLNLLAYFKFQGNFTNLAALSPAASTVGGPSLTALPYPYPSALAISHTGSNVICNNSETGAIDLQASGGLPPYQYSIDGVNYQSSPVFSNLNPGSYTIYVQSGANCVASATRTIQNKALLNPNLTANDVDCNGDTNGSATVNPNGGNGPNFQVTWSTGTTTNSLQNLAPSTYSVTVKDSCRVAGNELVVNGHFEQGPVGFTSQYNACASCIAGVGEELFENQFVVGVSANHHHNAFSGTGQGGAGNFMIVNGSSQANTNVWCQTIAVQPNTYYEFSAWVASVFAQSPAQLQFQANGQLLGPIFTAPNAVNTWNQFFSVWFSGANSSVNICILNQNTAIAGNDFAIDNISFKACLSCQINQNFTINEPQILSAIAQIQNAVCGTNTGTVTINANGGTVPYTYSLNNLDYTSNATFENLAPGTYSISVKDANNCEVLVSAVVEDNSEIMLEAGLDQTVCAGEQVTLNASGPSGFVWLSGIQNGVPFAPQQTAYYVVEINLGPSCYAIDSLLVTVHLLPNVQAGTDQNICQGESVTLNASGALTYQWSNGAENGSSVSPGLGLNTFTVTGTDVNGCTNTDAINIQVFPSPTVSITGNPGSGLAPLTVNFTNTFDSYFEYTWNFGYGANQTLNAASTTHTYENPGAYWVVVTASQNGCADSDSLLIQVLEPSFSFQVPNVFSPNGDDSNANFILTQINGAETLEHFHIQILNRWGQKMQSFEDIFFVWDGKDMQGNNAPEGVYFYKIEYTLQNQESKVLHGFVHLKR